MSMTVTISTQGHLVIPQRILEELHLHDGERLALSVEGVKLIYRLGMGKYCAREAEKWLGKAHRQP